MLNYVGRREITEKATVAKQEIICVSVRDQFYTLDETQVEDTIQGAALDETEYNSVKQQLIQIFSDTSS